MLLVFFLSAAFAAYKTRQRRLLDNVSSVLRNAAEQCELENLSKQHGRAVHNVTVADGGTGSSVGGSVVGDELSKIMV
jgi:hypothetical protein